MEAMERSEQITIGAIEAHWLVNRRRYIHIALEEVEDAEFFWGRHDFKEFKRLWKSGVPIAQIAEELERSEFSVLLLSLDLLMQEKIQPRKGWKIW